MQPMCLSFSILTLQQLHQTFNKNEMKIAHAAHGTPPAARVKVNTYVPARLVYNRHRLIDTAKTLSKQIILW